VVDGKLLIDNNRSENALRAVAVGRKNWLFFGSDDHAEAAANIMSLIASCKLHFSSVVIANGSVRGAHTNVAMFRVAVLGRRFSSVAMRS
jgi:hypothetical protein